jgi:hypothetical protein
MIFSADYGCDVGVDTGSPVSEDYGPHGNEFSGRVKGVEIAIAEAAESADHLVSAEDVVRVAHGAPMSLQATSAHGSKVHWAPCTGFGMVEHDHETVHALGQAQP